MQHLQFVGTACVAAGFVLMALSLCLGARYTYERNHHSGSGSGLSLAALLTLLVAAACSLALAGHVRNTRQFSCWLQHALDAVGRPSQCLEPRL